MASNLRAEAQTRPHRAHEEGHRLSPRGGSGPCAACRSWIAGCCVHPRPRRHAPASQEPDKLPDLKIEAQAARRALRCTEFAQCAVVRAHSSLVWRDLQMASMSPVYCKGTLANVLDLCACLWTAWLVLPKAKNRVEVLNCQCRHWGLRFGGVRNGVRPVSPRVHECASACTRMPYRHRRVRRE